MTPPSAIAASATSRSGALMTSQPQPCNKVSMPSSTEGSLSMQSAVVPASWLGSMREASRAGSSTGAAFERGTATAKCELPSADESSSTAEPSPGALREPVELHENVAPLRLRDADAGVVDVDAQSVAVAPAADQHAAGRRIFDGVGHQVLHQPAQQPAVGAHHQRAGDVFEFEPLGGGQRRKFQLDLAHQLVDAEAGEFRA